MIASIAPSPSITKGWPPSPVTGEPARGVVAPGVRAAIEPRGEGVAHIPRRARPATGDPKPALERAEGASRRRQQMGRYRRQQPVRPRRFSPGRDPHGERASMARRSRCGRQGITATSATTRRSASGPFSWRCASSGAGCAGAIPTSWISTTPSRARPDRAGSM